MKQIVFVTLFGLAACGRLDNIYLPPTQGYRSASSVYGAPYPQQYPAANNKFIGFPGAASPHIPILRLEDNRDGDGTYNYGYETGNGIVAQEHGDARGDGTRAQGGFSYRAPDGQQFQLHYTADENGYQPQGAHIPQISDAIRKSVEMNLADEARGIVDDGQYRAGPDEQYGVPATNTPFQYYGPPKKVVTPFKQYGPPTQQKVPFQQYGPPQKFRQQSSNYNQYGGYNHF